MRKRAIGCSGAAVLVVGVLIWSIMTISIRAPIANIVHIQTAGGPVPIHVVMFPSGVGVVNVGHDLKSRPQTRWDGHNGNVETHDLDFDERRFRLVFPGTGAELVLGPNQDGTPGLIGQWEQKTESGRTNSLPARSIRTNDQNWFLNERPNNTDDLIAAAFDGRWTVTVEHSRVIGQVRFIQWSGKDETSAGWIDGELASLDVSNRFFAGRFEGHQL
ncbi:MAG: hypothetical protein AB8F26_11200 [Phycisphaerales bacterium]